MTTATQTREIVRAYHDARTNKDMAEAIGYLAEDFTFASPLMRFEGAAEYAASTASFFDLVTGLDLISELYGEGEAILLYDLHTATPVAIQRTAEHFRVGADGISEIQILFDTAPWRPMLTAIGVIQG